MQGCFFMCRLAGFEPLKKRFDYQRKAGGERRSAELMSACATQAERRVILSRSPIKNSLAFCGAVLVLPPLEVEPMAVRFFMCRLAGFEPPEKGSSGMGKRKS